MKSKFKIIKIQRGLKEIQSLLNYLKDKKAFICGGYVRYCASPLKKPRPAVDVDIYCEDKPTFEILEQYFKDEGLEIRHENDVSITYLKPKKGVYKKCLTIQLIKPLRDGAIITSGTVEEIIDNFDFTVIRCAIVKRDNKWVVIADELFEKDEEKKFLRIRTIHCPISSLLRFMKYARKGYYSRPSQIMKLFIDWDSRTPEYKARILEFFAIIELDRDMTQEEIDELERLLRID